MNFRTFFIVCPILTIEFLLYRFSRVPAFNRYAYQKVSIERFRDNKLVWLKGRPNPTDYQNKINKFVEKVKKTVDNSEKINKIINLGENEYGTNIKNINPSKIEEQK